MKEPRPDDERLAALLEGRLVGPERDELLAYLAAADEDLLVFAKTAAVLREMEEDEAAQPAGEPADASPGRETLPPSARPGWRRRAPRWAAIPAVLVGLVALVLYLGPGRSAPAGPMQLAASALPLGQRMPPDWTDSLPWDGIVRGDESPPPGPAGAVQAGVFLLRLAVAVQSGDSAATAELAVKTMKRFEVQGTSRAFREIRDRAGEPADSLQPLLEQATERLEARWDPKYLRLGAWAEAARLATTRSDSAFFRTDDTHAMLRSAERLTRDDAGARAALAAVRTDMEGAPQWEKLKGSLTVLLRELAT